MKIIVFDIETTGLDEYRDEVLQVSMIDGDGNVLFNSYVKPYFHTSWDAAEAVHGISPADVVDAPYAHEIADQVRSIFDSADMLIAYNGKFDISFLERWCISFSFQNRNYYDVMYAFAEIYGEWNEYYQSYKWQKLSTCAAYYGYQFKAHDSLEDVKATLYCYKKIAGMEV